MKVFIKLVGSPQKKTKKKTKKNPIQTAKTEPASPVNSLDGDTSEGKSARREPWRRAGSLTKSSLPRRAMFSSSCVCSKSHGERQGGRGCRSPLPAAWGGGTWGSIGPPDPCRTSGLVTGQSVNLNFESSDCGWLEVKMSPANG